VAETDERRSLELTDPRALRAVAHPLRLRLVGLLRREGPLTATQAAERWLLPSPIRRLRSLPEPAE
jgi:hypothetical protein